MLISSMSNLIFAQRVCMYASRRIHIKLLHVRLGTLQSKCQLTFCLLVVLISASANALPANKIRHRGGVVGLHADVTSHEYRAAHQNGVVQDEWVIQGNDPSVLVGKALDRTVDVGEEAGRSEGDVVIGVDAASEQEIDAVAYLVRYGYLPHPEVSPSHPTAAELTLALILFQRYAGLSPSGRLDQATRRVMGRPRCGLPDLQPRQDYPPPGQKISISGQESPQRSYVVPQHEQNIFPFESDVPIDSSFPVREYPRRGKGFPSPGKELPPLPNVDVSVSKRDSGMIRAPERRQTLTSTDEARRNNRVRRCSPAEGPHSPHSPPEAPGSGPVHEGRTGRARRCIPPQEAELYLGPTLWQQRELSFRLLQNSSTLNYSQVHDAFSKAFELWSALTQISFIEVTSGDGDINILFASGFHQDGYTFDGKAGGEVGHAFYPGEGRGGDIHLDDDENWTIRLNTGGVDLFSVAVHEVGHSLGLAHSPQPHSVMRPWPHEHTSSPALHQEDIRAVQHLYGTRHPLSSTAPAIIHTLIPTLTPATPAAVRLATVDMEIVAPDACSVQFEALSLIRGDLFAFSGKWFWRYHSDKLLAGFPVLISRFWFSFPEDFERVDAVFERQTGEIVFFSGNRYWEFNGNQVLPRFSPNGRPIADFGLPTDLGGIDAAFVWGHNLRTYLIKDTMYWKLNESSQHVEAGYPRDMGVWGGVALPVGAAFTHSNRQTYFFRGPLYWAFNNDRMHTRHGYPRPITERWLRCLTPPTTPADQSSARLAVSEATPVRHVGFNMVLCGVVWLCVCVLRLVLHKEL